MHTNLLMTLFNALRLSLCCCVNSHQRRTICSTLGRHVMLLCCLNPRECGQLETFSMHAEDQQS